MSERAPRRRTAKRLHRGEKVLMFHGLQPDEEVVAVCRGVSHRIVNMSSRPIDLACIATDEVTWLRGKAMAKAAECSIRAAG